MKNKYKNKTSYLWLFLMFFAIGLGSLKAQPEIKKQFTPRISQKAPEKHKGKSIYRVQGDFTMIGNSNAFVNQPSQAYYGNAANMEFVNASPGRGIINSSTADFVLPNDIVDACTKVVFAGLYWTGRGNITDPGDDLPNGLNKRKVRFKAPNMNEYIELQSDEIYYSRGSDVNNMYAGFYDVTDYVINAGTGTYAVGNIATKEGSNLPNELIVDPNSDAGIGYYAGWGMVIVYENTLMKWRDITVFDGFAFIKNNPRLHNSFSDSFQYGELSVTGFRAVQQGDVNVKMGMMAGEGDKRLTGDTFQIQKRNSNQWEYLSHENNTVDNFFNSSIYTGGNSRNPNRQDNFGTDIAVFELDNTNNAIIDNNQTSTKFRYGSSGDTYVIFNITYAVDAYVPQLEVYNNILNEINHQDEVNPGDVLEFDMSIQNVGSEVIKDSQIRIVLPPNVHFVESNIELGGGQVRWEHPHSNNPERTPGGTVIWDLGRIIKPSDVSEVLARLKYKLRVTTDCTILTTSANNCSSQVILNGVATGVGEQSNIPINESFIRGYEPFPCEDHPVRDNLILNINVDSPLISNCIVPIESKTNIFKEFCYASDNLIPRNKIAQFYPEGTQFYSISPDLLNFRVSLVQNDFYVNPNGSETPYYAVIDVNRPNCYLNLATKVDIIESKPVVRNTSMCLGQEVKPNITLSDFGNDNGFSLYYSVDRNDASFSTNIPIPTRAGSNTYYVAEGKIEGGVLCLGPKQVYTINVAQLPRFERNLDNFYVCFESDKKISVSAVGNVDAVWEFFNKSTNLWEELTISSFNNKLYGEGLNIVVNNASELFNELRVRVKLINSQGCESISNEATIKVKRCNIPTNPMIRVKTNKTI